MGMCWPCAFIQVFISVCRLLSPLNSASASSYQGGEGAVPAGVPAPARSQDNSSLGCFSPGNQVMAGLE